MTLAINGVRASSVRITTPWSGAWFADVDVPLEQSAQPAPSGPAVISVGTGSLVGTVDANLSPAKFAGMSRVRVVAGGGGWEKPVGAKVYHSDGGVLSTAVLATTGAEVGERLVEALPSRLGVDYVRTAGPASRVLSGLTWYVDHTGVTMVAPRIVAPAPVDVRLLSYDPRTTVAEIATTTEILTPGMLLVDERAGSLKIRDVEQTFGPSGARARAWCIPATAVPAADGLPGSRFLATMSAIAREAVGVAYLSARRYRVVSQGGDGRLNLQSVDRSAPIPSLTLAKYATGIPGATFKIAPGSIVHVRFLNGSPTSPIVESYEQGPPPLGITLGTGLSPVALATGTKGALDALKTAVVAALGLVPGGSGAAATLNTAYSSAVATMSSTLLETD